MLTIAAVGVSWFVVVVLFYTAIDDFRKHSD